MHICSYSYLSFGEFSVKECKGNSNPHTIFLKLLFLLSFLFIHIMMTQSVMANARSKRHPIETPIAIPMLEESSDSAIYYVK